MVRRPIVLACLAALAAPAQAAPDQRTQVDEFAIGAGPDRPGIEQIAPGGDPVATPPQAHDRQVTTDQEQAPSAAPISQLSSSDDGAAPVQVAPPGAPGVRVSSVSNSADSRPQSAAPIKGADRCDPQLDRAKLAECRRILERRAGEFHAPTAPVLSAEQRLLAEQDSREYGAARSPDSLRLRIASHGDPDADARSNQELASIYLAGDQTPPSEPAQPTEPEAAANLAEVLRGIIVDMQANGGGSQ
ncbi:hypothetical protein [Croceibacterium aestuarii]|uniref:hypothetical protein n=1 Tax=Croceibacterium aestuarii TaxID=3064139 RepID=UPI00272E664E|nr:hypothetical protein [Croceibacterium sp. D39]